jgi:hypothetical protein
MNSVDGTAPQHHPAHHAEAVHEAKEGCLRAEWRQYVSDRGCMDICCGDVAPRDEAGDGPRVAAVIISTLEGTSCSAGLKKTRPHSAMRAII